MGQNNLAINLGTGPTWPIPPSTELMLTARLCRKKQVFSLNRCDANFKSLVCGTKKSTAPQAGSLVEMEGCLLKNAFEKLLQGNTFALTQDKPILRWYTLLGTSPYPTYRGGTSYLDPTTFKGDCSGMLSRSPPKIDHGIPCQHEHRSQWGSMKMHETL